MYERPAVAFLPAIYFCRLQTRYSMRLHIIIECGQRCTAPFYIRRSRTCRVFGRITAYCTCYCSSTQPEQWQHVAVSSKVQQELPPPAAPSLLETTSPTVPVLPSTVQPSLLESIMLYRCISTPRCFARTRCKGNTCLHHWW